MFPHIQRLMDCDDDTMKTVMRNTTRILGEEVSQLMDTQGMENLINLYIKERDLATLGKCSQHLYHRAGSCSVGGLIQLHQSRNAARFESYRFITNGKESIALYSELYCRLCKMSVFSYVLYQKRNVKEL